MASTRIQTADDSGVTDRPTGLWNESWVLVDRQLLEQKREKAIEDVLHPPKKPNQEQEN